MRRNVLRKGLEELLIGMDEEVVKTEIVDYDNRIIYLLDDIGEKTIQNYIMPILDFNREDDMLSEGEERQPITIYIDCNGGDIGWGMNLIDVIQASRTPITTIVFRAFSMGALIAMAGHTRKCYPHSSYLLHDGSMGMPPMKTSQVQDIYAFNLENIRKTDVFVVENSKISKKEYEKKRTREWFLDSAEALKYGLVDEIIQ